MIARKKRERKREVLLGTSYSFPGHNSAKR
jgi:hypothetical protein